MGTKLNRITCSAIALLVALGISSQANAAPDSDYPEVVITTADYTFTAPAEVQSGLVSVTIENDGKEPHHAQLARLKEGVTIEQFQSALQEGLEKAVPMVNWVGGPSMVDAGGTSTVTLRLEPGIHMLLCFVPDPSGVPHIAHGMAGAMTVIAGEAQETEEPTADLTVDLLDFAYAFSEEIAAGPQTWEIVNDGKEIHEISLIKLAEGASMEDVEHFMHTMQGPPPFASIGGMQAIDPGTTGWLHLDLTPGEYVAICHIPDLPSGKTHAMLGMVMPFVVE